MDKYTVFDSMGEADVAASANAYAKALTTWKSTNEMPSTQIEAAVESVFDSVNGPIHMPALVNFAVSRLSSNSDNFNSLSKRVHAYVVAQKATGRIAVKLGKGGGVSRIARPGEPITAPVAKTA